MTARSAAAPLAAAALAVVLAAGPPVLAVPPAAFAPSPAAAGCLPAPSDTTPATTDAARLLRLDAVHRLATGAGQAVAVVDTGVAPHPRLGSRLGGAGDLVAAGGDGRTDCDGHGTAVAGLLAAAPGTRDDVVGMAPAARLLTVRQTGTAPDGRPVGDIDSLADAIGRAVARGAGVVNLSEAACVPRLRAEREGTRLRAALRAAARADVVVVAAAGNLGVGGCVDPADGAGADQVALPGWFGEDVLTVGASGPDGGPAGFTVPGPWVDVAAPGVGLRSLAVDGGLRGGLDGTSFAAPWVAGLAALVRERFPELTADEVVDRILATARRPAGGRDAFVGQGVVDPLAALTTVPTRLRPGTATHTPTAVLAGTAPVEPGTGTGFADDARRGAARDPVALLAVAALAVAAGGGAIALRRRPDRG